LFSEQVNKALQELAVMDEYPDVIVGGGPGNLLVVHGRGEGRGYGLERTAKVRKMEERTRTRDGRGGITWRIY
jgi:hypothetical protein